MFSTSLASESDVRFKKKKKKKKASKVVAGFPQTLSAKHPRQHSILDRYRLDMMNSWILECLGSINDEYYSAILSNQYAASVCNKNTLSCFTFYCIFCSVLDILLQIILKFITKTCLFNYTENFTTKKNDFFK